PIKKTTGSDNARPTWSFDVPNRGYYAAVNWTHTFSPTLINETGIGMTYDTAYFECKTCEVPPIGISGMAGFGEGFAPTVFAQADFHWHDVVSLVHGNHTLKGGAEIFYNQDFAPFTPTDAGRPNYTFQSVFDFAADTPQFENGFDYNPQTGGQANVDRYWVDTYYAGFAQDDWKIKPNLTLSVGLRGEYLANPSERNGNRADLFLGAGSNFVDEIAGAYVKQDKYAFNSGTGRIAPRIGFAWQPAGHPDWSIRGGFGIFIDRGGNTTWSDTAFSNPPLVASVNLSVFTPGPQPVFGLCASATFPFNCAVPPLPVGLNARGGPAGVTVNVGGASLGLQLAYAMNRFLGIQHSFGSKWVVEVDYTGSRGVDLYSIIDRNRYVGERLVNNGAIIGPNPYFGSIDYADNSDSSDYEGLAFAVTKRLSHGLLFKTAFTWSKTIDLMSGVPGQAKGSENAAVINAYDINAQRGISSQDIPRQLTFDFVYQVPTPRNWGAIGKLLLGGWEASGIGTFAAGLPATVFTSTADYNADGFFYDVPNAPLTNIPSSGYSRSQYLNGVFTAADFPSPCPTAAPCGVEGNLGRNTYRGPGFAQVDAGFTKNNHIPWFTHEGADLQIRAEIANLFNRVNLTGFDTNLADGSFGRATGVNIARTPQFSIRVHF
ncbi:MAG: TonB-dependent receptor, partial [Bryobacteraceae bacterium]